MDICPKCGLPIEACICEEIVKNEQRIQIQTLKKKFGKINTEIIGFQDVDVRDIAKKMKQKLACGGTMKDNKIELQGNHLKRAKEILIELGFSADSINTE